VTLRIFFQPHQRLFGLTIDMAQITSLMDLHIVVLEYLKNNVTHVHHNPNDYILVKNNYLPLEDIDSLRRSWVACHGGPANEFEESDSHHLIMITRQQFMTMVTHIKGESERMRMKPLQRFAQQLRDQLAKEDRKARGLSDKYTAGCGYWNLGDGNVPDNDPPAMRIEPLPPQEPTREAGLDPKRNIFGARGERLPKTQSVMIDLLEDDDDDEIMEIQSQPTVSQAGLSQPAVL